MRLIFVCDKCKQWNELDYLRDGKTRSKYTSYEIKEMGLEIETDIESEISCFKEDSDIQIKDINDYEDYFEAENEIKSISFKCSNCGDELIIDF